MGAAHVSAVFTNWGKLIDGQPFRLLVHMALTAKDADNPPCYWAGADGMAEALGKEPNAAGRQAAKRAVAVLAKAGAIKAQKRGRKNVGNTKWEVVLFPPPQQDTNRTPENKGANVRGTHSAQVKGTDSDPSGVHIPPVRGTQTDPYRTTRTIRSEGEEEISSLTQVSPRARDEQAPKDEMTAFQAQAILDQAAKSGTDVVALMALAPEGSTRYQRRMWAAQQITTKESA
jgi:hypothetical protein